MRKTVKLTLSLNRETLGNLERLSGAGGPLLSQNSGCGRCDTTPSICIYVLCYAPSYDPAIC